MITEDYVSFETAKLLKEKGFDESCSRSYVKDKLAYSQGFNNSYYMIMYTDETYRPISAPTLQMVMKWLREVHNKSIEVRSQGLKSTGLGWVTEIYNLKNQDEEYNNPFTQPSYEEACEAAIRYTLENLI